MDLLRKKDLHPRVGAAKSTVADWIEEFGVYIPKTKHGNVTYYKPETIDVLLFIKVCREQNYQKQQIMELLSEKGFPITVDEAVDDIKEAIEGSNSRDTLLTVMQTMGQAVTKIAEQDERLDRQDERLNEQNEALETLRSKQSNSDGRMDELEKRTSEIDLLKQQMELIQKQFETTTEQLEQTKKELAKEKKSWWARMFGSKE
jgi:DNA-binding transcriptional MerR regulator